MNRLDGISRRPFRSPLGALAATLALATLVLWLSACAAESDEPAPDTLPADDATAEALREIALATGEALRELDEAPAPTSPPGGGSEAAELVVPEGAELLLAAEEGGLKRPVFVAFLSEDCDSCAQAERSMMAVSEPFLDRIDVLRVDVQDEGADALRRRYAVREIPSFVILGTDGAPQANFGAWPGDEAVAGYLESVLLIEAESADE